MKGRRKPPRDQSKDTASSGLNAQMLLTSKDRISSVDLRMITQIGAFNAAEITALVEKCAQDAGGTVEESRRALDMWTEDRNANSKSRCDNCGISAFSKPAKCPFCGNALHKSSRMAVVTFTSGSRETWDSLCGSFPTIEAVMLCLGVPLFFGGLVVLVISSLR